MDSVPNWMKKLIITIYLFVSPYLLFSQMGITSDSIPVSQMKNLPFNKRQLIIPAVFFTYGIASIESETLRQIDSEIREEVKENIDKKFTVDDFSVFLPALSVYGLNMAGMKGRNSFKDRSLILGASSILMTTTVLGIKTLTHIKRPDNSSDDSFPSGHTATAFAGAEFLYQEYKDVSPWIGVTGYAIATGTGFFRIYNNRHWLSDVMMGAGIGILSTKVAYWTFHYFQLKKRKDQKNMSSLMLPYYNGKLAGAALVINFR